MPSRLFFIFILLSLQACVKNSDGGYDLPLLYKIDIRQGNLVEQVTLDKLRINMSKEQVRFIMGTPTVIDPFRNDRWDYIFSERKGGKTRKQRHIILHFKNDKLKGVSGDVRSVLQGNHDAIMQGKNA